MRKTNCLLGVLLFTGALSAGALQPQAAGPAHARDGACNAKEIRPGMDCAATKRVRATRPLIPMQVTKTTLDRSVCGRLQGQVERDTCLNHVEANA